MARAPIGLNTNTTLPLDLLNDTQKTDLLTKVMQPDIIFRCIMENQSAMALQEINPDVNFYTITIKPINAEKCVAIDSSIDHTQQNESDGFDILRNYLKNSSEAKIERLLINAK